MRQVALNVGNRFDEIHGVVVVLFDARRNREDVRVKDDIFWWEADFINQDTISVSTDF